MGDTNRSAALGRIRQSYGRPSVKTYPTSPPPREQGTGPSEPEDPKAALMALRAQQVGQRPRVELDAGTLDRIPELAQQTGIHPALLRQMMEETAAGAGEGYAVPYGSAQKATPMRVMKPSEPHAEPDVEPDGDVDDAQMLAAKARAKGGKS